MEKPTKVTAWTWITEPLCLAEDLAVKATCEWYRLLKIVLFPETLTAPLKTKRAKGNGKRNERAY